MPYSSLARREDLMSLSIFGAALCLLPLLLLPLAGSQVGANAELTDVSIVQLIATPAVWEGKYVRVRGYCRVAFEETGLYLHREDSDILNTRNGIWLDIDPAAHKQLNDKYAFVVGRFTSRSRGHLGAWSGTVRDVQKLGPLATRSEVERMGEAP
jgi:hypothetical protein